MVLGCDKSLLNICRVNEWLSFSEGQITKELEKIRQSLDIFSVNVVAQLLRAPSQRLRGLVRGENDQGTEAAN